MPSDLKGSVCPDGMNWRDEVQGMNSKMGQCGVCARWTKEGYHLPSGNRNPRTGEMVSVPAKKVASFKPSKEFAAALNKEAEPTPQLEEAPTDS